MLAALAWITAVVLSLERAELTARANAEHQEALRLALWRMDSWLAPRLATEGGRATPRLIEPVLALLRHRRQAG